MLISKGGKPLKHCSKCDRTLPLTAFNKQSKTQDGRQYYCRQCQKDHKMYYRYGLSPNDVGQMLIQQNGRCDICTVPLIGAGATGADFCIDHNHSTGETRSLLCNACNIVLGHARDDTEVLASAIEYLEAWG